MRASGRVDSVLQPITPDTIPPREFPDEVIAAFNAEIATRWDGTQATIQQETMVARISGALGLERAEVFSCRLLDVAEVFRRAGWRVVYDKPGYCENYAAHWVFSRPRT